MRQKREIPGWMPRDGFEDHCAQVTKRTQSTMSPPWLETHWQSHPKSRTDGTSGPTKVPCCNKKVSFRNSVI